MKKYYGITKSNWFFLMIIILSFLLLKLLFYSYTFVNYDEGVYVGMAKYYASSGEEGYYEEIRPIGVSLLMTPLYLFFNSFILAKTMIFLVNIASIILLFHIVRKEFDEKIAKYSTMLYALSPFFLKFSGMILNDLIAYFFVFIALYYAWNKKDFQAGLMLGISFLFKFVGPLGGLATLSVILFRDIEIVQKIKSSIFQGLGGLVGIIPFFINAIINNTGTLVQKIKTPLIDASNIIQGGVWIYGQSGVKVYFSVFFSLNILILIGLIFFLIKSKKDFKQNSLIIFAASFFIYYSFFVSRFDIRYLTSLLVPLSIIGGIGLTKIKIRKQKSLKKYVGPAITLLLLLNIVFSADYFHEDTKTDWNLISEIKDKDVMTNTGFAMIHAKKTDLITSSNSMQMDVLNFFRSKDELLILSLYEYRCSNDYCRLELEKRLSSLFYNFNISNCGYLYGHSVMILNGEKTISNEECKNILGLELEEVSKEKEIFFKISEIHINDKGEILLIDGLKKAVEMLDGYKVILSFVDDGNLPNEETKAEIKNLYSQDIDNIIFAVDNLYGSLFKHFSDRYGNTYYNPPYDSGAPALDQLCVNGFWNQETKNCDQIDIYLLTDWENLKFTPSVKVQDELTVLLKMDDKIGIDFPLYSLNDYNFNVLNSTGDFLKAYK